jgi:hypothetical protein
MYPPNVTGKDMEMNRDELSNNDSDFFRETSEAEFDEYMSNNNMNSEFDVNPSVNPESVIENETVIKQNKEITNDDFKVQI